MMMQMLAAGGLGTITDNTRPADSRNPNGYFESSRVLDHENYSTLFSNARGRVIKVIHRHLHYLPPEHSYRVLFMERDISEIVASQQRYLGDQSANSLALLMSLVDALDWAEAQTNLDVQVFSYSEALSDTLSFVQRVARFVQYPLDVHAMANVASSELRHHCSDNVREA